MHVDFSLPPSVGRDLQEIIELAPLPGLGADPKCDATFRRIQSVLSAQPKLRGTLSEAALWLLAGELDRSHEVSQSQESPDGSYWHGIMHRREGDFWNSKYWFRRVGSHPVQTQLASYLKENSHKYSGNGLPWLDLSNPAKVSTTLVDCCERGLASQPAQIAQLQRICWVEWQFLFAHQCDERARQLK